MIKQISVEESPATLSIIECQGSLVVQGWSRRDIRVKGEGNVSYEGGTVMVTGQSDLRIDAPYDSLLQAKQVQGDVAIKRIQGIISLDHVHGDQE